MSPKDITGDCEFCSRVNVVLKLQHNDMMCSECIARENAVIASVKVIEESQAKDERIQIKSDVMEAATTSFIELHAAILNNPDIAEGDRKYKMAELASERIQKLTAAIFEHDAIGMAMKNEKMAWIKNTQSLIATLDAAKQAKFAHISVNYRPVTPKVPTNKVKSDKPKGISTRPVSPASKYTHKDVVEACAKYKADVATVKMMLIARAAKGLTPEMAAREFAEKHSN